jgi:hypothetical protein
MIPHNKEMKLTGLTVFILFFGIALIEAFRNRDWAEASLFVALGLLFFWTEMRTRANR